MFLTTPETHNLANGSLMDQLPLNLFILTL